MREKRKRRKGEREGVREKGEGIEGIKKGVREKRR